MTDTSSEAATSTKKARNVENFYFNEKGERSARPMPDVVGFGKKFLGSGQEVVRHLVDFHQESLAQAAAFGLQQVGQNAYGAATDDDERQDMLEARWESIQGGNWSADRQVGPRSSDLVDAFAQARADQGKESSDEWKETIRQKLESGEIAAKDLQANPLIKAKLDAIKAARAAERAKASAAKATDSAELPDL
jgi:hypothetical protein